MVGVVPGLRTLLKGGGEEGGVKKKRKKTNQSSKAPNQRILFEGFTYKHTLKNWARNQTLVVPRK